MTDQSLFLDILKCLQKEIHDTAKSKGFYNNPPSVAERIALMHSELSEALEAERKSILQDDHIPKYTGVEAEMADTIIRILDFAEYKNLRLGEAILAKMAYNKNRPFMHGGKKL